VGGQESSEAGTTHPPRTAPGMGPGRLGLHRRQNSHWPGLQACWCTLQAQHKFKCGSTQGGGQGEGVGFVGLSTRNLSHGGSSAAMFDRGAASRLLLTNLHI